MTCSRCIETIELYKCPRAVRDGLCQECIDAQEPDSITDDPEAMDMLRELYDRGYNHDDICSVFDAFSLDSDPMLAETTTEG